MLVLGTVEKDAELADNLTEVIIARVAQRGGTEIAGKEEFRARLGVENERRAQACLDDIACLGRAAVSLGVRRIVAGSIGTRGKQFLFNLNLDNVETGKVENRVFRLVEGGVEDLIRAVQEGTDELFLPRVEPGKIQVASMPAGARVSIDNAYLGVTPLISGTLLAGKHNVRVEADGRFPWMSKVEVLPAQELQIKLTAGQPARAATLAHLRRLRLGSGWRRVALASRRLPGRALAAPADRERRAPTPSRTSIRRSTSPCAANISFGAGALFAVVSLYHFLRYGEDIFGRTEKYERDPLTARWLPPSHRLRRIATHW